MRNARGIHLIFVLCCVLFLGFSMNATAAGKIETVEVTGMGATLEKAIKNATKAAVRQVVGMYVVAEAATKNRKPIKDEVLSNSNAMVRKFTTIEKGVDEDGIHMVIAKVEVEVEYVGFEIPPAFVIGYGLDYAEKYRNLRAIGVLAPHVYQGE